ncbi:DUF4326 domain-containing protein [Janthinobacterium lividum]|uniref:DUF4326 domain-containing protein n=1 Tax=Janthinobacterium lividum TaxID=29581 RepID=A0ABU0XW47_9BURK|nr:DUF4326 domain-containing protein [Janthinobacterium lividum]MDQ4627787.1 DUF4326 domain-containing protein [Janthinobacterium lividum]MDQ4676605.1 DUF4326 domain-containing protein [Janthinobacterium lividum]MDQ4686923.1 DUF4326 domain-containing protein [Janthinobacterium lividum]
MNKLLILYPPEFQSFSKFERKVSNIASNLTEFSVIYPSDKNEFIETFFSAKGEISIKKTSDWQCEDITHAIIFDDGEIFNAEVDFIKSKEIPMRIIKINITRVVNIKKEIKYSSLRRTDEYEYIGRGSYWGNPYSMFSGDSREEVIRKFKYDFDFEKFPNKEKSEVFKLAGKRLGCFCKPEACHGDILADFLNKWDDGK